MTGFISDEGYTAGPVVATGGAANTGAAPNVPCISGCPFDIAIPGTGETIPPVL